MQFSPFTSVLTFVVADRCLDVELNLFINLKESRNCVSIYALKTLIRR